MEKHGLVSVLEWLPTEFTSYPFLTRYVALNQLEYRVRERWEIIYRLTPLFHVSSDGAECTAAGAMAVPATLKNGTQCTNEGSRKARLKDA